MRFQVGVSGDEVPVAVCGVSSAGADVCVETTGLGVVDGEGGSKGGQDREERGQQPTREHAQTRRTSFCVVEHLCVGAIDTLLDRTARSALLWSLLLVNRAAQTNQSQPRRCANGKHTHEDCVQPLPLVVTSQCRIDVAYMRWTQRKRDGWWRLTEQSRLHSWASSRTSASILYNWLNSSFSVSVPVHLIPCEIVPNVHCNVRVIWAGARRDTKCEGGRRRARLSLVEYMCAVR